MWQTLVQGKEHDTWSLKEPGLSPAFSTNHNRHESLRRLWDPFNPGFLISHTSRGCSAVLNRPGTQGVPSK